MITNERIQELIELIEDDGARNHPIDRLFGDVSDSLNELLSLRRNVSFAIALGFDYDGMNTVEGLKTVIDEMIEMLKGEAKWG